MTDTKPALPEATQPTVWQKPSCPQCTGAKLGLKGEGVVPELRELLADENAEVLAAFKAHGFASAPIIQFPAVRSGDEVLFEATTVAGNRIDIIQQYGKALRAAA